MTYRLASPADARKVATVLTDAFANYNMYRAVLSSFFTIHYQLFTSASIVQTSTPPILVW